MLQRCCNPEPRRLKRKPRRRGQRTEVREGASKSSAPPGTPEGVQIGKGYKVIRRRHTARFLPSSPIRAKYLCSLGFPPRAGKWRNSITREESKYGEGNHNSGRGQLSCQEPDHQRSAETRNRQARRIASDGAPRPAQNDGDEARLRLRPVRRLQRNTQRQGRPLLHHALEERARVLADHHNRRNRHAGQPPRAPVGHDSLRSDSVRLLHARLHHERQGAPRPEPEPDARRGPRVVQQKLDGLPLHRLQADSRRGHEGRRHPARRGKNRRPREDVQARRLRLEQQLSASLRDIQGDGALGLRRRRQAEAARGIPLRLSLFARRRAPREGQQNRRQRSGEDARRIQGSHLQGRQGNEPHPRTGRLRLSAHRRLGAPHNGRRRRQDSPVGRRRRHRLRRHRDQRARCGPENQGRLRASSRAHRHLPG